MIPPGTSPPPTAPVREPRSTLYVLGSATIAALVLGLTLFLLIRGFQWRAALAALRAEPGIEILSVERVGFFKKRLLGLRDPLAPAAEGILQKHQIGPHAAEVVLTEYHSLNTPYALEREAREAARFDDLRRSLLTAVGEFAATTTAKREEDLERITQILFQARFPEAMKTVNLEREGDSWFAKGSLYAPARERFVADAPAYIVEGELLFDHLVDLTQSRSSSIRQDIESTNLLAVDLDGVHVHVDRMRRLVADYDEVCLRSDLPAARLRLEIETNDPSTVLNQISAIKGELTAPGGIRGDRFLSDSFQPGHPDEAPKAVLKLVPTPAPPQ